MPIRKTAGASPKAEIYTRFAADLAAGRDPEPAMLATLLEKLRADLVREIQRRSLWHLPPSYLGQHGHGAWTDAGRSRAEGPLDELLLDAFTAIFVERLPSLSGYIDQGNSLEGLIPHLLRNFVQELQERNDRLGVRLFRMLRSAVRQAAALGSVEIVGGDIRVTGGTVLCGGESPEISSAEVRRELLLGRVSRWNDELLGDLVTAHNRRVPAVVSRLAELVAELSEAGLGTFRFGELLGALRLDVRRRWAALFEVELGAELGELAWEEGEEPEAWEALCRAVEPEAELRVLAEDTFRHLIDCVARHIEAMEAPERTRDHLFRLWGYLRVFATEEAPQIGRDRQGRLPATKVLARWLGLPRDRFTELLDTIGGFLTHCRSREAFEGGVTL